MHRFRRILWDLVPQGGPCPAYFKIAIAMLMVRARVPLTIYCLWAIVFSKIIDVLCLVMKGTDIRLYNRSTLD